MDTPHDTPLRKCTQCGEAKPETAEFFFRLGNKLQAECKSCMKERSRVYRAEHAEEIQAQRRRYRETHVEEIHEYTQRNYTEHAEERREYARNYRLEHPEEVERRNRRYRETHREEQRERSRRYRAEHPEWVKKWNTSEYKRAYSREYQRRRKIECPDKVREIQRRWYSNHREQSIASSLRWQALNTEAQKNYRRRYYAEHSEEYQEHSRRWRTEHPEQVRIYKFRRRALELGNGGAHTADDIRLQIRAQTDKRGRLHCHWCGKLIEDNNYHVDHVTPLAKGGSNGAENIVITHPKCNLSKGAKTPAEFMGRLF